MAAYKLIQDIEAEDHILGPLTLRQFIYGLVAALMYYICFILLSKGVIVLLIIFLPIALLATFFAFPFKRDQPTEVWALAKLKFILKPKVRIWDQSGIKETVTITAPNRVEENLTNGLSHDEAKSRLKALALTIDSRGWAVKGMLESPEAIGETDNSDRLITPGSIPRPVPDEIIPVVDMFDNSSPQTQHIDGIIAENRKEHLKELTQKMQQEGQQKYTPISDSITNEESLSRNLQMRNTLSNMSFSNMHSFSAKPNVLAQTKQLTKTKPLSHESVATTQVTGPHINPTALNYALSNGSDISIQTIANEANKSSEVIVKLH